MILVSYLYAAYMVLTGVYDCVAITSDLDSSVLTFMWYLEAY